MPTCIHLAIAMRDAVFPPRCMACDDPCPRDPRRPGLCGACDHGLWPVDSALCDRCGFLLPMPPSPHPLRCGRCLIHPPSIRRTRGAFLHGGPIAHAIVGLKHGSALHAERLIALAEIHGRLPDPGPGPRLALVPVPLHPRRCRARGFNQSFLLASALAHRIRNGTVSRALVRTRDTPIQPGLSPLQRRDNVRGAFAARRTVRGGRALLVDDVRTTGATLDAAGETLIRAGFDSVDAWTVSVVSHAVA